MMMENSIKVSYSGTGNRIYSIKPGYVYEVYRVSTAILGDAYKLVVVDNKSELRGSKNRFIWKCEKWKKNPLLTQVFNKVVPKYNQYEDYGIDSLYVGNDGHLYKEEGSVLYRANTIVDDVDKLEIREGVAMIESFSFMWSRYKTIVLPKSLKSTEKNAFAYCMGLKTIVINSENLSIVDTSDIEYKEIVVPKGTYNYYKSLLPKAKVIEIGEE